MDLNKIDEIGKDKNVLNERVVSRKDIPQYTGSVESLDAMFNNPNNQPTEMYNPREAIKRMNENMTEGKTLGGKKMPNAIRESIVNNPLMMPSEDDDMSKFTDRLEQTLGGIQRSMGILKESERMDREKNVQQRINESVSDTRVSPASTSNGGVDYELIKLIVERVIDDKLKNSGMLTEGASRENSSELSVMSIGKKFLFLDNDDNIYECTLTYKGKNKKRKK